MSDRPEPAAHLAASLLRWIRNQDKGRTLGDGTPVIWEADIVTADAGDKIICLCTNDEDRVRREIHERELKRQAGAFYIPRGGDCEPVPRLGLPLIRVLHDPLL